MEEWSYSKAGVDISEEEKAIKAIAEQLSETFKNRKGVLKDIGTFANLIDIGNGKALALSTDGVGSKVLIAEQLEKYDTVGIDLIAMNVNDLICLGAEPIALVDYLAVRKPNENIMSEIGEGLKKGAEQAGIAIIGGETATLPEIIAGDDNAFDIAGTAVGIVETEKAVTGENIKEGDVLIGLLSSGIHSNGLTLARKLLHDKSDLVELLTPTKIYVKEILNLLDKVEVTGLANITGGGLLNLKRLNENIGFKITNWPEVPEIFKKIQKRGHVPEEEMYKTFNMGIGFCVVVPESEAEKALDTLNEAMVIGRAVEGNKIIKDNTHY
ncbi:MAG: phosphoribosylformylglycinamidine cyclo-ligase [Candidatus Undinarchaeales archaeon]